MPSPLRLALLAPLGLVLPAIVLAQPVVPRPAPAPRPAQPAKPVPGKPNPPPEEVDWRGLEEGGKRTKQPPSDVAQRIQNAPYRNEIATTDANRLLITNALTLERRRIWEAKGPIVATAFSADGNWLYAVTDRGDLAAVEVDTARAVLMGGAPPNADESVVDVQALTAAEGQLHAAVVLAKGKPAEACTAWTSPTRAVIRRSLQGKPADKVETRPGWPEDGRKGRTTVISPNTKYRATFGPGGLVINGRFGGGDAQLNRTALPAGLFDLGWMRDSDGLAALYPRKSAGECRHRLGMRVWRDDDQKNAKGWAEFTLPEWVELVRGDRPYEAPAMAPDGMRWVGVDPRGVVLIEPAPRHRGPLPLVAPPSLAWPKLRPGIRPLPSQVGAGLRSAEILLEQGDLDAAGKAVAKAPAGPDRAKLEQRLAKLKETLERRASELGLPVAELRADRPPPARPTPAPLPADATPPAP